MPTRGKKTETDREKRIAERVISPDHWRCAICLVKIYVADDGWKRARCELRCEQRCIEARMNLAATNSWSLEPTGLITVNAPEF
jgi:hypothetical protein